MRKIKIFDTTLRDGEQSPGCSMKMDDKIRVASMLDAMKVDVIEAGFAASNENDFNAIKEISKICNYSIVTSLARCNKSDIDKAYESIKDAKRGRIHVFIATSKIHMKDKLHKSKKEVKRIVKEMVSYAKSKCDDIEFSLEDATRTDKKFACKIIDIAIESGATTINIPDTVGIMEPEEFGKFIKYIRKHSDIDKVDISVHCHNDLGMATANSVEAIKRGATQVEVTINGIGERAGNTSLEEIVAVIKTKKKLDVYTDIVINQIKNMSDEVVSVTGSTIQSNKAIVGENAFKHEAGIHQDGVIKNRSTYEIMDPLMFGIDTNNIVIGIHSGKGAIINKVKLLGYEIDDYDIQGIVNDIKQWFDYQINNDTKVKEIPDDVFISIVDNNIHGKVKKLV